jgi:hypothetical protein
VEEITQGAARDSTSQPRPSMHAATTPPPPSGPSGSGGNRRRHRQGDRGGGAGDGRGGGGGRGGRGAPWPSIYDPWTGQLIMWPGPAPVAPPPRPAPSQRDLLALGGSSLPPASFADWIADSRASFHTTPYASILTSTHPPPPSCPSSIIVGDGSALPVTSVGDLVHPGSFRLHNVLVAPNIIHNLLSVRQFTIDNSCSIEFDPSGLFVKDLTSRQLLA